MKLLNKKWKAFLVLFTTLFLVSVSAFIFNAINVKANVYNLETDTEIKTEYELDSEIIIPSAEFVNNGQSIPATGYYLIFPDNVAKTGTEFVLNQLGKYSLVYTATVDGRLLKADKTFIVKDNLYQTTTIDGTVEYKDRLPVASGDGESAPLADVGGISVGLTSADTFKYSKVINLNELGNEPFLQFFPHNCSWYISPNSRTNIENMYYRIKLIDAYNSANYLSISFHYLSDGGSLYVSANMPDQPRVGLEPIETIPDEIPKDRRLIEKDGKYYLGHYNNFFGTYVNRVAYAGLGYSLYLDNETKEFTLIAKDIHHKTVNTYLITDLDDPNIYDDKLFEGFSTGEVYLEISASDFLGTNTVANFEVTKIGGKTVTMENDYVDDVAPSIVVENYDDGVISIAKGQPTAIPEAEYFDVNGVKVIKVSAFYGYGSDNPTEIAIIDGKITARRLGEYTLIYSATDNYGATSQKIVRLNCVEAEDNQIVKFVPKNKLINVEAGKIYNLGVPTLSSANGEEYYSVYYINKSTGEKFEIKNDSFAPATLGEHQMVYVYGDKYLEFTYTYDFKVNTSNNVLFSNPVLPNYFIKGMKYTLDSVTASSFNTGKVVESKADVYVKNDNGSYSAKPIDIYNFEVTANSTVQFKYVKNGKSLESAVIKVIDVYSNNKLRLQNYFAGDFVKTTASSGVTLTANASQGNSTFEFINPIAISKFAFEFVVPKTSANFKAVKISIIDYYDRDNLVEFSIEDTLRGTSRLTYAGKGVVINKTFAGEKFSLTLDTLKKTVMDDSGAVISYEGDFISNRVILAVTLEGIEGASAVTVSKVNNQPINAVQTDRIAPSIIYTNDDRGYAQINSEAIIHKAEGLDELSPYYRNNLKVTVLDADGKHVKAKDGTVLNNVYADKDYIISLSKYGRYDITYTYFDQVLNGDARTKIENDYYEVVDSQLPTISLNNGVENTVISAKVGDTITVSGYKVSDNLTSENNLKVRIVVAIPNRENLYLQGNTRTFKAEFEGLYKIKYLCVDQAGNTSMASYYVNVTAE